jgi:hypothetical protein
MSTGVSADLVLKVIGEKAGSAARERALEHLTASQDVALSDVDEPSAARHGCAHSVLSFGAKRASSWPPIAAALTWAIMFGLGSFVASPRRKPAEARM